MSRRMIVIVTFLALVLITVVNLNVTGFCYSQWRYVPDDEFVRIAIKRSLELSPTVRRLQAPSASAADVIQYSSIDEFIDRNANCCVVERDDLGVLQNILYPKWYRIFGVYILLVKVSYQFKVSPPDYFYDVTYPMTSCGAIGNHVGWFGIHDRRAR